MKSASHAVRAVADGRREAYRLDPTPISSEGGQGIVFGATHRSTGLRVAFKRLRAVTEEGRARMRREIQVAEELADHPNVMPVLDASEACDWFVMPLATHNLEQRRPAVATDEAELHRLIQSVARALGAAHNLSWVHRDVKPANILWFDESTDPSDTWVLADWGLGRGPRGDTSQPQRTKTGVFYGTEGFAPPELALDAHDATAASDIYSLGRVIAWVLTDAWPQANLPLLPDEARWRRVVRITTHNDFRRRPQTIDEFLELLTAELQEIATPPVIKGESLILRIKADDAGAASRLFDLALDNPDEAELYLDLLPQIPTDLVAMATEEDHARASEILERVTLHMQENWGHRDFNWANAVIRFVLDIARAAVELDDLDLLADASSALFELDSDWDRWTVQREIRRWLERLRGDAAVSVARELRRFPNAAIHYDDLPSEQTVDRSIRAVVSELLNP